MPSSRAARRPRAAGVDACAARLAECRTRIQRRNVDGYLVVNRADQWYLTGFDGEDGATLVLPGRCYLVTDGRFREEADAAGPLFKPIVRTVSLSEAIGKAVKRHRLSRLGFDPAHMTVALHTALRKACRPARLAPVPRFLEEQRLSKDAGEVAAIEEAVRVAQEAFTRTLRRIRIGMTERELAAELQHEMIRLGASGPSFPIIVAEGPRSSLPHATPGERPIRDGSAVLIDWGATVGHYRSDLTRMVFIRRIPPRFRDMYHHVLVAQQRGIEAIRPGALMSAVDGAARGYLKSVGLDKAFAHGLGHGVGLDIHEPPRLAAKVKEPLRAGMVVTVEPGVYFPGVGGVRIEDDVLVTPQGYRVLTSLPRDLEQMIVRPARG